MFWQGLARVSACQTNQMMDIFPHLCQDWVSKHCMDKHRLQIQILIQHLAPSLVKENGADRTVEIPLQELTYMLMSERCCSHK